MRIISWSRIRDYCRQPERRAAEPHFGAWYDIVARADWRNHNDVRRYFAKASIVGDCVVFNIHNNQFRLITRHRYAAHIVYVLKIMTHSEYDQGRWIDECGCRQTRIERLRESRLSESERG